MNPLGRASVNALAQFDPAPVGRALGDGLFRAADEVSSFFHSAIGQMGTAISRLAGPAEHAAQFTASTAIDAEPQQHPGELLHFGKPHPLVRFADRARAQETFAEVTRIGMPKGMATSWAENKAAKASRPDPETYLDSAYMREHLAQFDEGAVSFITPWAFEKYTVDLNSASYHGRAEGLFVLPARWAKEVITAGLADPGIASAIEAAKEPANDHSLRYARLVEFVERKMGIPAGCWSKESSKLLAVFIERPRELNLRFTTGREEGANAEWRPGGYTLGGVPEAMVDKVDLDKGEVIPFYGFAELMMDRSPTAQGAI